jgi:MSHA pilin protein MshD
MYGHPTRRAVFGLSLIELLIFIGIVSIALAAVLRVFVQSTSASADPVLRRQALAVAESLLEEVQRLPFTWCDGDDPAVESASSAAGCTLAADALGPEAGENRGTLPAFDHVNDYHGLVLSGISDLSGTAVPGLAGYSATIGVAPAALHTLDAADGNALRITVNVTGPAGVVVSLTGWRSRHAPDVSL